MARVIFVLPGSRSLVITGRTGHAEQARGNNRILPRDACSYNDLLRHCEGPTVYGCCERFYCIEIANVTLDRLIMHHIIPRTIFACVEIQGFDVQCQVRGSVSLYVSVGYWV